MFLLGLFAASLSVTIRVCHKRWYTNTFLTVKLNGVIKKNVPEPSLSNIQKYSRAINIGSRIDEKLKSHVDRAEVVKNEWTLHDLRYDIDMILEFLQQTLGSNRDETIAATTDDKMSGGTILDRDCAISKVLKAKGTLREWISGIETRGELYERSKEADHTEEDGDGDKDEGDIDYGNDKNAEDMMLIVVNEVVDQVPYVHENFAAAQMRAK